MEYNGGYPFYGDAVGILMLDMKAPLIPGNVGNAYSYNFPVRYKVLKTMPSDWWDDEQGPDDARGEIFLNAAKELESEGCKAITSGCGFFAIYQKRTADALKIPVFTSPLLMVPMVSRMLGKNGRVGIITANGERLSEGAYLPDVGIDDSISYAIGGLENCPEFYDVHCTCNKKTINPPKMEAEVVQRSVDLLEEYPDIGAFVFECSDLPPYAQAVARKTGLPVFDFISLAHLVYRAIAPVKYPDFIG
jgi:hypothetical protein